jgi:hypothetical protein
LKLRFINKRRNLNIKILILGPLGQRLDNYLGGNPNPTVGQIYGGYPFYQGYGYHYRRW